MECDRLRVCDIISVVTVGGAEADKHVNDEDCIEDGICPLVVCPTGLVEHNDKWSVGRRVNHAKHEERVPPRDQRALMVEDAALAAVHGADESLLPQIRTSCSRTGWAEDSRCKK